MRAQALPVVRQMKLGDDKLRLVSIVQLVQQLDCTKDRSGPLQEIVKIVRMAVCRGPVGAPT
jgi:hypothetical protein